MRSRLLIVGLLIAGMNTGCPMSSPPPADDPNDGLVDTDNNGFPELPPPPNVTTTESMAVSIVNSLSREQLIGLIPGDGLGPLGGLFDLLEINVTFDITLRYDNGEEALHSIERELGAFEVRFEAICPQTVDVIAGVEATAPFLGTLFSEEFPLTFSRDGRGVTGRFECERVLMVETFLDEATGRPDADFSIEDF